MTYGLQFINDGGSVQIDQGYKNFHVRELGNVTLGTALGAGTNLYKGSVTVSGCVSPMCAIRSPDGPVGLYFTSISGSSYTYTFIGFQNAVVNYIVFDEQVTSSDTFGIEVLNDSGQTVFHSSLKPLRVAGVISNTGSTLSLTASRVYAAVIPAPGISWQYDASLSYGGYTGIYTSWITGIACGNENIKLFRHQYETYPYTSGGSDYTATASNIIIVDVTNFATYTITPPPDVTPNAVNWTNISTTAVSANSNSQTIDGIDMAILLGIGKSSSNITVEPIRAGTNLGDVGTFTASSGQTVSFALSNNATTTQTGTITIKNKSDNDTVLDTFTYSLGGADVTPGAVNWANISPGNYTGTNATQTISGITAPISITWTDTQTLVTVQARINGGAWQNSPISVTNGQTVQFQATNNDASTRSGTVTVKNASDGSVTLDTFTFTLTAAP